MRGSGNGSELPATELQKRVEVEVAQSLPTTVRQFEDSLIANKFQCNFSTPYKPYTVKTRECVYFERGPVSDNACVSGEDVAILISYGYTNDESPAIVREFKTTVITRPDGKAHGSGICFPL